MKDKEKQIEEINDIISEEYNNGNDNWYDIADKVYNKLSKDSVVLSKEEYEKVLEENKSLERLLSLIDDLPKENLLDIDKAIETIKQKERKETAEKILNEVAITIKTQSVNDYNFDDKVIEEPILLEKLKEIATREGVEIKE